MLFNSGVFLQFFAAFLLLYWLVRQSLPARNILIVVASYLFYGWWAPSGSKAPVASDAPAFWLEALWHGRFLALLIMTSLVDYTVGLGLERLQAPRQRQAVLAASIVVNLGILGFFKYCNFFVESVRVLLTQFGLPAHPRTLDLVLPVGISFYTFQSMSYAIDVYRRAIPATHNFVNFLAFVSFFPQLVAGPIERAAHLLPQFERTVVITRAMLEEGVWLILWGLFKKVVVADNLAPLTDLVYASAHFSAPTVVLGTIAFAGQIYCDFSGYSDIARGTARVLGFDIMWNFDLPYAATNLREFWRRWHISLSSWLRDYLYFSLGGNRRGAGRTYFNLLLTMLLGGLWHGAAWNFVLWGLWHGGGLALHRAWTKDFKFQISNFKFFGGVRWAATFLFVLYGWLLFRAKSLGQIVNMTRGLAEFSAPPWIQSFSLNLLVFATPLVLMEIWQVQSRNRLVPLSLPVWAKAGLQGTLLVAIVVFWEKQEIPFIYFQF